MLYQLVVLSLVFGAESSHGQTQAPGTPLRFGPVAPEPPKRRAASPADSNAEQEMAKALGQMFQGGGGAGGKGSSAGSKSKANSGGTEMETFRQSLNNTNLDPGDGTMEPCGTLPAQVQKDLKEMLDFRKGCALTARSGTQRMAINDYSCLSGAPKMYLFDADGQCQKKMTTSFGNGGGRYATANECPKACSTANTKMTPPGMHMTVVHGGTKPYNSSNSLGLAGLEGQGSKNRGILIHGSNNPGIASSWGCAGVAQGNLPAVMKYLGTGALVYNSFQSNQLAGGCGSSAGLTRQSPASCRMDPGAAVPSGGGGGSGGATGASAMLDFIRQKFLAAIKTTERVRR